METDGSTSLANRITGDERAVTIPIDAAHGMAGNISAGDHVDIYAGFNVKKLRLTAHWTRLPHERPVLKLLVADVLVLEFLRTSGSSSIGAGGTKDQLTLRMGDQDAASTAFAADNGVLWAILRPRSMRIRRARTSSRSRPSSSACRRERRTSSSAVGRPGMNQTSRALVAVDEGVDHALVQAALPAHQRRDPDRRHRRRPRRELGDAAGDADRPPHRRLHGLFRPRSLPDRRRGQAAAPTGPSSSSSRAAGRLRAPDLRGRRGRHPRPPDRLRGRSRSRLQKAMARKPGTAVATRHQRSRR